MDWRSPADEFRSPGSITIPDVFGGTRALELEQTAKIAPDGDMFDRPVPHDRVDMEVLSLPGAHEPVGSQSVPSRTDSVRGRRDNRSMILTAEQVPRGTAVLNPFVVVDNASEFIAFVLEVLGGSENERARTPTPGGKLIHSEVDLGGVTLMIADRLDGWAARPGLLQVWVTDVQATLDAGSSRGASVVTPATPFYGERNLGRMLDPFGNLWWLYAPAPGQADPMPAWEGGSDLVFRTIDEAMKGFPQSRA